MNMETMDPVCIVGVARTPMGSFQGSLSAVSAPDLGATAIKAAVSRAQLTANDIDEVIMGCVLQSGLGQAPARQAALNAGLNQSTHCTTINKMCGSGMQAVMFAQDLLSLGRRQVIIAGGLESMSNAPYLLPKARSGMRLGHAQVIDSMFYDGLEDAYDKGKLMGVFAENTAEKYGFSREQQDDFAVRSLTRAQNAIKNSHFEQEIAAVTISSRKGDIVVDTDENPGQARIDKIPALKPAFKKDGTVTAANASSISDGACALVLMKLSEAKKRGLKPIAKIVEQSSFSHEPSWFTTAPVGAMKNLFEKTGWSSNDVDLYEINEAFAVVTMAAIADLSLDDAKVNINGGACALGHPIGASGARIIATLLSSLKQTGGERGVASLCIGGGEGVALAIEMMN